ncbi:MAG TPA: CBS domain-containing protein [Methanomassiliicoccales archaeon]|nr:CBS domain-containing protein [Methanomassiliicoccales archaeon]
MTNVGEVMTANPIVAQVPGSRTDVLKIMIKHNITGLPVVKRSDGTLTGLITRQDIFNKPDEDQLAMLMNRDPPTIGPKDHVERAANIFCKGGVRHLPVVDKNRLVGIVTPTDLLGVVEKAGFSETVESVIKSTCVPIFEESPLVLALVTLKVSRVSALPVLDERGRLVGILTDRDLFNTSIVNGRVAKTEMGIGKDEDEWSWEGMRSVMKLWYEVSKLELPGATVKDVMVRSPTTVFRKTSVSEAARIMRKNDFGQLPVRDAKDNLLAMIYDLDIISVLTGE